MATLHTINKSPLTHTTLTSCLRIARPGDSILLLEDGVYAITDNHRHRQQLRDAIGNGIHVYVLSPDMQQRLPHAQLPTGIEAVDYTGFVALTTRHQCTQSWYS